MSMDNKIMTKQVIVWA